MDRIADFLTQDFVVLVEAFFLHDEFLQLFIKGGKEVVHLCRRLGIRLLVFPEEGWFESSDDFFCYSKCTFLFFLSS